MADPLSIAAILGLIFAARKCSEANEENPQVLETNTSNFERQNPISEAVFEDIVEKIGEEISNAKSSIYLAIAWFTNKQLYRFYV